MCGHWLRSRQVWASGQYECNCGIVHLVLAGAVRREQRFDDVHLVLARAVCREQRCDGL
jgi:hypothetical protein